MDDRKKLIVHLRRISGVIDKAIRNGPDGTLEGKFKEEQPTFIHYSLAFYLSGSLAYLEGEDGVYSWQKISQNNQNFDSFVNNNPAPPKQNYNSRGITIASLDALASIRNAIIHHDGDLSKNRDLNSLTKVISANIPGVELNGSIITLHHEFLEFVRVATLAVRNYHGEN